MILNNIDNLILELMSRRAAIRAGYNASRGVTLSQFRRQPRVIQDKVEKGKLAYDKFNLADKIKATTIGITNDPKQTAAGLIKGAADTAVGLTTGVNPSTVNDAVIGATNVIKNIRENPNQPNTIKAFKLATVPINAAVDIAADIPMSIPNAIYRQTEQSRYLASRDINRENMRKSRQHKLAETYKLYPQYMSI